MISPEIIHTSSKRRRFHLVGIGGIGMCALARLLSESGAEVSGSDAKDSESLKALREAGISVSLGHDSRLIEGVSEVIFSPAIPKRNVELLAAQEKGIKILSRAEALAEFTNGRRPVCIAGSHGKTTTTAMLAFIFEHNGFDPSYMIGGLSPSLEKRNAKIGTGPFIMEACEAFGALHGWVPEHCIITNVDDEHAEHYGGLEGLKRAFRDMIGRVSQGGTIAIHEDAISLLNLRNTGGCHVISYGTGIASAFHAKLEEISETGTRSTIFEGGEEIGQLELQVPGQHNVCNALASIIVARAFGISFQNIARTLLKFQGVDRRCQLIGEASGVRVFDDYAHHPTEIEAVLAVLHRAVHMQGRLVVAFEPQLHSRVRRLVSSFAAALSVVNLLILMPVDASGEAFVDPSDDLLADALHSLKVNVLRAATPEQVEAVALKYLQDGDIFVGVGPGQVASVGKLILKKLQSGGEGFPKLRPGKLAISLGQIAPIAENDTVLAHFFQNVAVAPDAPAVICADQRISYAELANQANNLASYLMGEGIGKGEVVAVRLARSVNRTVAFLGIMIAGAIYLPIDPSTPSERATFILTDAEAKVLISDSTQNLNQSGVRVLLISPPILTSAERPEHQLPTGRDAAYVIYTSGTTGIPKGVLVEHISLLNCAQASVSKFNISRTSRVSQVSSFGFDIAVGDMAMALYVGACLVSPDDNSAQPGSPLARYIYDSGITHLSITPSALSVLPCWNYPALTHVIVCGEKCPDDLAARWMSDRHFFNAYGPAEATVWCTVEECLPGIPVTIGHAIENTRIYILDEDRNPVLRGDSGEIWIAGVGLARGYLNRTELTGERFPSLVLGDEITRSYKTGDLAMMSEDGRIHFLGRTDDQVKIRGFRVELSEIEASLRRHPMIRDAVVDIRKDSADKDKLVGYIIPVQANMPSTEDIAEFLGGWLPNYMIPVTYIQIECIPLNQNRKLNRRALPSALPSNTRNIKVLKKASTSTEKALIEIFRKELFLSAGCGIRDTLVELGMDSLQTANLLLAIEAHFQIELPLEAFSNVATVEILALLVERAGPKCSQEFFTDNSLISSIIRKQLGHLSAWTGFRIASDSLICSHNATGTLPPLFWCFQGNPEHESLAAHLGCEQPLYGMRSGHLVFRYKQENIRTLAIKYASEMMALQPEGTFRLGGNCQGGIIAREIALELYSRGRMASFLCLVGQDRFPSYDGPVTLIFSAESPRNPYQTMKDPDVVFRVAYKAGYSTSVISGDDTSYFVDPHIKKLAEILRVYLRNIPETN